ncbi:unnamed protein product [Aphanomyces euteiches]|uniref:EF-hand domain-containing protein n=1 Tax=Aphanomyces euteiches TaxID=100861 RepID=A0A6G0X1C6_9STRA|nr:hypothetical protein Ae201684_009502 [Aphanomyces euteiches]KAH9086058.1 hypothetical protein Ae201684P_005754 [Aphanomyces euteiches]KAH9136850.1 hypothetical protein AeRB84_018182 [Aphanomyces euteiches]
MWNRSKLAVRLTQRHVLSGRRLANRHGAVTALSFNQQRFISLEALRSSLSTFPTSVIDDQLDIKALNNVNSLVSSVQFSPLPADDTFMKWVDEHVPVGEATLSKEAFDEVVNKAIDALETLEAEAWNDNKINDKDNTSELVEGGHKGLLYLLLKYKCKDAARFFPLLDKENTGSISTSELRKLLTVYSGADAKEWLNHNFGVMDSNGDGLVSEPEMQQLLLNILGVHKSVLKDLLEKHMMHWTPKHSKQFAKDILEFETTLKVSEKIRCTWHFAGVPPIPEEDKFKDPPPVPPRFTMSLDELHTSLKDEFPELDNIFVQYTQAIVDARRQFYETRNSKRTNYVRGVGFLLFCGITDYIITILM